jgi:vacuolar-type H+-ATPase subunit F/Vma7
MPLLKGAQNMRSNIKELMSGVESQSRHKAILTIAKKNNISYEEAQMKQAIRIAQAQARKK